MEYFIYISIFIGVLMESNISYSRNERYGALGGILFGHFSDGYDLVLISYLFIPMSIHFHTGIANLALAMTISLVFSAFGGIIFGWFADKFGRKKGLMLSLAIFGLATLLTAAINSLWQLYLLRAIEGLGIGGEWGIGFAQITEVWSPKTRATGGGVLQAVFIIGSITGAFTAGFTLAHYGPDLGWRYAFVIAGVVALIGIAVVQFIMPESKFWKDYDHKRKKGELPPGYDIRSPINQIFSKKVRRWTLFSLLIGGANLFIYFSYASFMPTLLHGVMKIPLADYTYMLVLGQAIAVPFYWINGFLADKFGRKSSAIGYGILYIIAVISFMVANIMRSPYIAVATFPLFYAYTFVSIGQGVSGEYGVWYSEHFPTKMRSTATNFGYMVGRGFAGGLAPIVIPLIAGSIGGFEQYGIAMSIAMLVGVIVQFIGFFGLRETKGTEVTTL